MTTPQQDVSRSADLHALTFASAKDQAQALAEGRVSAIDLLEQSLTRIARFDNDLNAVIARDDEQARLRFKMSRAR